MRCMAAARWLGRGRDMTRDCAPTGIEPVASHSPSEKERLKLFDVNILDSPSDIRRGLAGMVRPEALPMSNKISDRYAQAQVPGEVIEIPVVVQQVIPALDASGSNHRIDGLANGDAEFAQRPEILRRLNRDFLSAQLYHHQRSQHFPGFVEVSFVTEALQYLRQD